MRPPAPNDAGRTYTPDDLDDGATTGFGSLLGTRSTLEPGEPGSSDATLPSGPASTPSQLFATLAEGTGTDREGRASCLPAEIELVDQVSGGQMGRVWRAIDHRGGTTIAVKESRHGGPVFIQALKREFRLGSDIVHPNVVAMRELFIDEQSCAISMEWVDGREFDVGWSAVGLRPALRQLVAGLSAVHDAGLIHGDLKCRNVLVTDTGRVLLVDFGLAQVASTLAPALGGTVAYMAPEVRTGGRPTASADRFALGVMLYRALTGQHPEWLDTTRSGRRTSELRFERPEVVAPDADPALADLATRLLATDPEARPSLDEVRTVLGTGTAQASTPRTWWLARPALWEQLGAATRPGVAGVRLVALVGPSGAGKSSLLRRFLSQAPVRPVWSRCDPLEQVAWRGFDAIADEVPRSLGRPARWDDAVARSIQTAGTLFPQLLGRPGDLPTTITDDGRRRAVRSLAGLVSRAAQRVPLAVVVDDLQWLGRDARKLFPVWLRALRGDVLVCVVARSRADLPEGFDFTVVEVDPIESAALEPGASTTAAPPSYLRPAPQTDPTAMARWTDAVRSDVRALGAAVWQAVQWCALAGGPIDLSHLERLGVAPADVRLAAVARVLRLRSEGRLRVVSVVHGRVAEAVYSAPDDPTEAHRTLGHVLATGPERWARSAIAHLEQAAETEAALDARIRAGTWALSQGAFEAAVELLEQARDLGADPARWGLVLGQSQLALGQTEAALVTWRSAREAATDLDRIRLSSRIIDLEFGHGRTQRGLDEISAMLASVGERLPASSVAAAWRAWGIPSLEWFQSTRARATPVELRLAALWHAARTVSIVAPITGALIHVRHERLSEQHDVPLSKVLAATWRLWNHRGQGQPTKSAEARIHAIMHRSPELVADYPELHLQIESSRAAGCLGGAELAEAGDRFDACGTEWRAMRGECWEVRFCRSACLQTRVHEWPIHDSAQLIEDFRTQAEALGDVRSSTVLAHAAGLFPVLYRTGSPDEMAAYVEAAAEAWTDITPPESELRLITARAQAAMAQGDLERARRLVAKAPLRVTALRSFRMVRFALDGLHARILAQSPEARGGVRRCRRLLAGLRKAGGPVLLGLAAGIEAGLVRAEGDDAQARALRDTAIAELEQARQHLMGAALRQSDAELQQRGFADPAGFRRFLFGAAAVDLYTL